MHDGQNKRGGDKGARRQERLEAELKENLRKRKDQARARAQTLKGQGSEPSGGERGE